MYLQTVLQRIDAVKKFTATDLYMLNEAIFNLPEQDVIDRSMQTRLFQTMQKITRAYNADKVDDDPNFFYDYLALLATMQNQPFFTSKESESMLGWIMQALSVETPPEPPPPPPAPAPQKPSSREYMLEREVEELREENAGLRAGLEEMRGLSEAVTTLQQWALPYAEDEAAEEVEETLPEKGAKPKEKVQAASSLDPDPEEGKEDKPVPKRRARKKTWGRTQHDDRQVHIFTLRSTSGARAEISTYGARLVSLCAWDGKGALSDVVLGFDDLAGYEADTMYQGCVAGRFANRIAGGKFSLEGEEHTLAVNNGPNALHGGLQGFSRKVWDVVKASGDTVTLRLESPDMEEGYPGKLAVTVEYSLNGSGRDAVLSIRYKAETDKPTILNLTNHAYFNLHGVGGTETPTVAGHQLAVAADQFLPTDATNIPLGELRSVVDAQHLHGEDGDDAVVRAPFDFRPERSPARCLGAGLCGRDGIPTTGDPQLEFGKGYDHSFVLREVPSSPSDSRAGGTRPLGLAQDSEGNWSREREADVVVTEPASGRRLDVFTAEPAVQIYSGNWLDNAGLGKRGAPAYGPNTGLCIETQHYPNSPNQEAFPTTALYPGEPWETTTVYWFSVVE